MEIASCGLYLQPMTNGALEEKFVREFFCPYFIVSLHAITEHGEVVLKGVFAAYLLPDGINRVIPQWSDLTAVAVFTQAHLSSIDAAVVIEVVGRRPTAHVENPQW